jgi:hypothetical protein
VAAVSQKAHMDVENEVKVNQKAEMEFESEAVVSQKVEMDIESEVRAVVSMETERLEVVSDECIEAEVVQAAETGAFWELFASAQVESGAGAVIVRESFTLADVLEEEDVLEELAGSVAMLEYFISDTTFRELIQLMLTEGGSLLHRFVACQVLCYQLPQISNKFWEKDFFNCLVMPLEGRPPLPVLGSEYCCRVLMRLSQACPKQLLTRLKEKPSILISVCRNIGTSGCTNMLIALVEANCVLIDDPVASASTSSLSSSSSSAAGAGGGAGGGLAVRAVRRLNPEFAEWLASIGMSIELMRGLLPPSQVCIFTLCC